MRAAAVLRVVALALLLAPGLTAGQSEAAERAVGLREAIRMALEKSDALLIERESMGAATAAVRGAKGAYDPLLEVAGGWSRSKDPANASSSFSPTGLVPEIESAEAGASIRQLLPTGGELSLSARGGRRTNDDPSVPMSPAYDTRVGVEVRQPLLRDLGTDAARLSVRVANANRDGAAASLRRTLNETVAAVERGYWSLVAARQGATVREESVRLAQEQLDQTRQRRETGLVPESELAQPRAELERRRSEWFAALEVVKREENTLKLLILGDGDEDLWISAIAPTDSAAVEIAPVDAAASLRRALSNRPELEEAAAIVKRRLAETAFARNGIWPSLDAVASYDRFGLAGSATSAGSIPPGLSGDLGQSFETLEGGDYDAARVALVLGFPVLNRTARAEAAAARHRERQAEAEQTRVRKIIRAEVLDAVAALETTGQRIGATRAGREAAEVQLASESDRYEAGLSTNFLVLTRQNDLSRARLDEISALTDYRKASTALSRATGSLFEERGLDRP